MRTLIVTSALLALAACNVSKDNNGVTVQYDQNTAENTVADVSNTAQNVAGDIGNDVSKTGKKIENKIGDKNDRDADDKSGNQANATTNK